MSLPNNLMVTQVTRTRPVSPSKILQLEQCPLRYALSTEFLQVAAIPLGMSAIRGIVIHELIGENLGRELPSAPVLRGMFIQAAERAILEKGSPLLKKTLREVAGQVLFPMKDLLSTSSFVRQILVRYGESQPLNTRGSPVSGRTAPGIFGPERKVLSEKLDVEGRADLIYKDSSSAIHVVDYKSGKVTDENGLPKRDFLLQVATYGLAVSERFPPPQKIILELLSPDSEWAGQLDEGVALEVKTLLLQVSALLPKNTRIDANRLATIGQHCQSCSYRPACPAYTAALESEQIGQTCQCDLSGTIFEVIQKADMAIIRLRTKGGRIAAIAGVPRDIYPELHVGAHIRAYSLGITDVLSRAQYPANFYMYRPESPRESAFSAIILPIDVNPT